jgi:hypothetical protein
LRQQLEFASPLRERYGLDAILGEALVDERQGEDRSRLEGHVSDRA